MILPSIFWVRWLTVWVSETIEWNIGWDDRQFWNDGTFFGVASGYVLLKKLWKIWNSTASVASSLTSRSKAAGFGHCILLLESLVFHHYCRALKYPNGRKVVQMISCDIHTSLTICCTKLQNWKHINTRENRAVLLEVLNHVCSRLPEKSLEWLEWKTFLADTKGWAELSALEVVTWSWQFGTLQGSNHWEKAQPPQVSNSQAVWDFWSSKGRALVPTWTWGHWTHTKCFPNPQNEVDSLTTAVVTYHSPVLTLRAAPISRLWMLWPGDTNETKKKMPILALEGTTQCKGHFRIFFLPLWAVTLMLSCWLILSGPQTFSHEAGSSTITGHNPLYLPM